MIIDGHAHAFGGYLTTESIAETLDAAGAQQVVLSPGESARDRGYRLPDLAARWPERDLMYAVNRVVRAAIALTGKAGNIVPGNEAVFRLRQSRPDRIRQCYWFDPRTTDALAVLDRCFAEWRFCMVKVHQCWTPFEVDDQVIESLAAWCDEKGLPLFAHLYCRRDVPRFLELCRSHRRTRFILGHLIGAASAEETLCRLDNVYLDTSPPQLIGAKRILAAVRLFGSGRIIMGSDTPYGSGNLRRAIDRINSLPLTSRDKEMILGGNLAAMLKPAVDDLVGAPAGQPRDGCRT